MPSKNSHTRDFEFQKNEQTVHAGSANEDGAPADGWSGSRFGEAHIAYLDLAAKVEQHRREGQSLSPVYRVYLRDRMGCIVSGRTIAVESDDVAVKIASILRRACADVCVKFEVWKGEVLVAGCGAVEPQLMHEELSRRNQQIVIDTEIALRDSHAALAESRQLLDTIDAWQGKDFQKATPRRREQ